MSRLNRYDPEALDFLTHSGINVAELENPRQAMLSAGVEKMVQMRDVVSGLERTELKRDLDVLRTRGESEELIKKMAEDVAVENNAPTWQKISGLYPKAAAAMNPAERRMALAKLHHAAQQLIRFELNKATLPTPVAESVEGLPQKTFLWDPLPEICHYLEISKAALTRFLRELTGVSANELVDMIRAESLKEKLRKVLFPALKELIEQIKKERVEDRWFGKIGALTIWKRLKDSRRHPKFHRAVLAIELGFPSHQRMYRACLLAFGKTPCQIEWECVEEAARNLDCTVRREPEPAVHSSQLSVDSGQWTKNSRSRTLLSPTHPMPDSIARSLINKFAPRCLRSISIQI